MDNNAIAQIKKILDSYEQEGQTSVTKQMMNDKLSEFMLMMKYEEKSKNTLKKYERDIKKFIDFVSDGLVTKEETMKYKQHLIDEGYEVSSINSFVTILNKYLKFLDAENIRIKQLRVQFEGSIADSISDAEYNKMLRKSKEIGQIDTYFIMRILAETGIRIEELKFFTVEALKKNKFVITVSNKGKSRDVVIHQELSRGLRRYMRNQKITAGYLFPGKVQGKMLNHSTIWRRMKKIAGYSKVKKEKIHAHAFRHYFARKFIEQHPGDILTLADILGHSSLNTTRIYNKSTTADKRKMIENMQFRTPSKSQNR